MQSLKLRNLILVTFFATSLLFAANQVLAQEPGGNFDSPSLKSSGPMYVDGRHLYTANGEQVILRGVNEMLIYSSDRTGAWVFDEIARTGANCVRVIAADSADNGGSNLSSQELASAIQNANNAGMILMAGPWMATCDWSHLQECVDWWLQSDIREAVQNNEDYFLLNIANEAGGTVSDSQYLTRYKSAITQLRAAGYQCPLVIDAASCGQGAEQALSAYDSLLSHDPLSNIIVSWHTYNHGSTDEIKALYDTNIAQAVNDSICFIIGEGPTPTSWTCSASPYRYGMQKCQENKIGWLGWSWGLVNNGDCATYDWTEDGYYGNWETDAGRILAVDHEYSIANTSIRPTSLEYLSASPGVLLFDSESSSQDIYVSSSLNWSISDDEDWIEVNPANGSHCDTIRVTVLENSDLTLRSGIITVTGSDITKQITVRQTGSGQGQIQTIALSDFDSGTLDPFYSWGAPLSIEANPDGTPEDSVALLDQTSHPWNGITSWWDNGDLFVGADSLSVDVYANAAGVIKFHCDNSVSAGVDYDQTIEGVPAQTWTRYTLEVSNLSVSDYKQFAIQYDKANLIYFDNFILYKTIEPLDQYVIFDPAAYPQDSLGAGMAIVDIDTATYLQLVVDQWDQSVTLMDSVLVPMGAEEITFEIKYTSGTSGVDINNAWYKYLFKNSSGIDLFNAEGDANTITNLTTLVTNCNNNITQANGVYINSFMLAGQSKTNWSTLSGDTIWIGKTSFVDPTVEINKDRNVPVSFVLEQNYPNPFNPRTKIKFNLGAPSKVNLTVFNTLGQKIKTLVNQRLTAGSYIFEFDGSNLASGIYIYRLETNTFIAQKKMILFK